MSETLTEPQYEALRWIDKNQGHKSEWTANGKMPRKGPETWTHLRITSKTGSILIARADLRAINPLIEAAPADERRVFRPNAAGREALAKASA